MKRSLRHSFSGLVLGMACLFMQAMNGKAQTVLAVNEVRIVSTSGIVAAKSADGKTVTITLENATAGETPIVAKQGPGNTVATGAASNAFISVPSAGSFMMGPNTQVKLPKAGETGHTLELLKGRLFMNISAEEVKKSGDATFRLKTPAALLAVKGTRFFAVSEGKTDIAGVHQGMVEVYEPVLKQRVVLNAGNAVPINLGQMGKERPLSSDEKANQKNYMILEAKIGAVNSLGMRFVFVPDTNVLMCIHETRHKDYAAFAADVPGGSASWKDQTYKSVTNNGGMSNGFTVTNGADHPVVWMNWKNAQAFCAWLSKKEGKTYRLPTDREWSCAVGIGQKEKWTKDSTPETLDGKVTNEYPWGGKYPPKTADLVGNYADMSYKGQYATSNIIFIEGYMDGFPTTAPVMSFKPNKLGIYDLGGNVVELCDDWYNAAKTERVLRGGSFKEGSSSSLISSLRYHRNPSPIDYGQGFRVVIEVR